VVERARCFGAKAPQHDAGWRLCLSHCRPNLRPRESWCPAWHDVGLHGV